MEPTPIADYLRTTEQEGHHGTTRTGIDVEEDAHLPVRRDVRNSSNMLSARRVCTHELGEALDQPVRLAVATTLPGDVAGGAGLDVGEVHKLALAEVVGACYCCHLALGIVGREERVKRRKLGGNGGRGSEGSCWTPGAAL